jgi:hypothetical protein
MFRFFRALNFLQVRSVAEMEEIEFVSSERYGMYGRMVYTKIAMGGEDGRNQSITIYER